MVLSMFLAHFSSSPFIVITVVIVIPGYAELLEIAHVVVIGIITTVINLVIIAVLMLDFSSSPFIIITVVIVIPGYAVLLEIAHIVIIGFSRTVINLVISNVWISLFNI